MASLLRRFRSLTKKDKAPKEPQRACPDGLVPRGGGSPVEDRHHPEDQGVRGSGRFPIGGDESLPNYSSSASGESLSHFRMRPFPEPDVSDVSIPTASGVVTPLVHGRYGRAGYGGGTTVDPAAIEQARRNLELMVNIRTDSEPEATTDTSLPDAAESEADVVDQGMRRPGLAGSFSFDDLPGVQHVQLLRDKVTRALGFVLKFEFVEEEGIHLTYIGSVSQTACILPDATLMSGDILLTANGQLIAGHTKQHVLQILQGKTNRLVELTIIRLHNKIFSRDSRGELHQLCHRVRSHLQGEANRPSQLLEQRPVTPAQSGEPPSLSSSYPDTLLSLNDRLASDDDDVGGGDDDDDDDDGPVPAAPPTITLPVAEQDSNESLHQQSTPLVQEPSPAHSETNSEMSPTDEELNRFDAISLAVLRTEHRIELGKSLDPYFELWQIMADRGGMSVKEIRLLEVRCGDRRFTEAVLKELEQRRSMSVGQLFRFLKEKGRLDIMQYVKESIVPELPSMEQKEREGSRGRPQRPVPLYSSMTSSLSSTDMSSLSTDVGYNEPLSDQPYTVQQISTPPVVSIVDCAPVQAPVIASFLPSSRPSPRRNAGACQICSVKHTEYVYISYAQDMKKYVQQFVAWLRRCGMAVHYDQMDEDGRAAKPALQWKTEQLEGAEFVVVLCSPGYIRQLNDTAADNRSSPCCQPGCGISSDISYIARDMYQRNGNYKCIPVLVNGFEYNCIPTFLRNTHAYRFPDQEESIWRRLTRTKEFELPPLGKKRVLKPRKEW